MKSQELQWTVVPYDAEQIDGRTYCSAAITVLPKLLDTTTAEAQLSDYPDMLNWPKTLLYADLALVIDGKTVPMSDLEFIDEQADPEIWRAVFTKKTLVRPYEMKHFTDYRIFSFPVNGVQETLGKMYSVMAKKYALTQPVMESAKYGTSFGKQSTQTVQMPEILETLNFIMADEKIESQMRQLKEGFQQQGTATARKMMQSSTKSNVREIKRGPIDMRTDSPESMLYQPFGSTPAGQLHAAELYHTARNYPVPGMFEGKEAERIGRPKMSVPTYDFHQVISVMREYPKMLRLLGIVIHVRFALPNGTSAKDEIFCKASWTKPMALPTTDLFPHTAYDLTTSGDPAYWQFLPLAEAGSEIKGALLCLDDTSHFAITQIDVDGAALKTVGYAKGLKHWTTMTARQNDERRESATPSVRGIGLGLVRVNRGLKLAKSMLRSVKNYNKIIGGTKVVLYADDLVRGYRVDIYDDTAKSWQSLMRRNATYKFLKASGDLATTGIKALDEEGTLTFGVTRPHAPEDAPIKDLYAHEMVAHWEGWSMVVPRIGNFIDPDDKTTTGATSKNINTPPASYDYQVATEMETVKGSLPRLRYGRKYRMRVRWVDVCGNGAKFTELDPNDFKCSSPLITYMRWDPIISPTIAFKAQPVEGESLERMVIRNYNASDDDSVSVDTTETSERHFFPPLAAVETCERHGKMDSSPTGPMNGDNTTYSMIVQRTGANHDLPEQWYTRDASGNLVPTATPKDTDTRAPLVTSGATQVPYLPDPLSRGLTLQNVPGLGVGEFMEVTLAGVNMATIASPRGVASIVFDPDASWPAFSSIILKMVSGTTKPSWDTGTRTLTVYVEKGEQVQLTFSSNVGESETEATNNMAIHGMWKAVADAGLAPDQQKAAMRGLAWLVTPGRVLNLVHGTQKPLKKPAVKKGEVSFRDFSATDAEITLDDTYVHAKTSHKVDMHSEWSMWIDDVNKPLPEEHKERAFFYEQVVTDLTKDTISNVAKQEFGDTKYRGVTYVPTATTRFREYMPRAIGNDASKITRRGDGKLLDVLNSKRPDAVKLLYVVPSFHWVEEQRLLVGNTITSTRKGGGLRVWMDRPWYSSGNGELLGVVLYSTQKWKAKPASSEGKSGKFGKSGTTLGFTSKVGSLGSSGVVSSMFANTKVDIPETIEPFVTQWGLDPIWLSAPTPSDATPLVTNFVDPKVVLTNVSLEETGVVQRYVVVGYEPQYDADRRKWFCDIAIDPGDSYYPFIKLSLVRLQPMSLSDPDTGRDVYCSRTILSEFCQLAPDRKATVKIEDDKKSITVMVEGKTYRANTTGQIGSEIEVTLEKRTSGAAVANDVAWQPVLTQRIDRIHASNVWAGMVVLPATVDSTQYRVVIKEYEQFFSDTEQRQSNLGGMKDGGTMEFTLDKRVVYADVLPLF